MYSRNYPFALTSRMGTNIKKLKYPLLVIAMATVGFLWPLAATAQFAVGAKFGAGITSTQAKDVDLPSIPGVIFSWQAGLMAQKNFNKKWALQHELLFIRKGYEAVEQGIAFGSFIFDGDIVTDYLEWGIGAKYFLLANNDTDIYLLAGPYAGYMVRGRFQGERGLAGLTSPFSQELEYGEEGIDRFDLGLNFGFGGQFDLGKLWFFAEVRYAQGLWNINGDNLDGSIRNYGAYATIGWMGYLSGDK